MVDRWRPETHTFHLSFGETTVTLEDVAMLTGLPIAGSAIGPSVPLIGWQDEILGRFQDILPQEPEHTMQESVKFSGDARQHAAIEL